MNSMFTNYPKALLFLFFGIATFWVNQPTAKAQCSVVYFGPNGTNQPACLGDTVRFLLTAGGSSFDFNAGALPAGWNTGAGFTVSVVPCAAPSLTNDPFYWASTAGGGTPFIETNDLDVSTGGQIIFDMRYSINSGASPCEGPDLADEGVTLQYSINAGGTWVDIEYWDPAPGTVGTLPFTGAWQTLAVPIPPAAQTPATRLRWIQFNSSGPDFDNWGLDNINVFPAVPANWTMGNGSSFSNTSDLVFVYSLPGTYTVDATGTLPNGTVCTASTSITVNPIPNPFLFTTENSGVAGGDNIVCAGEPVQFAAAGGATYLWSTGATGTALTVNPVISTTYTVTVADNAGCSADRSQFITVSSTPTLSVTPATTVICEGDPVTLDASGSGTTYTWDTGQNAASITFTPTQSATYTVTTTDANQCQSNFTAEVGVQVLPSLSVTATAIVITPGVTVTISASSSVPLGGGGVTVSPVSPTNVSLFDDDTEDNLPIGFSFNFFDNTYTEFGISSNGYLFFDQGGGFITSGCCTGDFITDTFEPNNFIAFAWEDIDPGNGGQPAQNLVRYATVGTAPNRVLVVEFFNVDHWPSGNPITVQTMLFECDSHIADTGSLLCT